MTSCADCKYHTQFDEEDCTCEKLGCTEHYKYCWLQDGKEECQYYEEVNYDKQIRLNNRG